jgi:hypothetical protein
MTVTVVHHASMTAARSTSATVGTPGSFNAGSAIPPNLTALQQAPTINGGATWIGVVGRYIRLGNGTTAHWNGTSWAAGATTS